MRLLLALACLARARGLSPPARGLSPPAGVTVRRLGRAEVAPAAQLLLASFEPPTGYNPVERALIGAETALSLGQRLGTSAMLVATAADDGVVGFVKLDLEVTAVKGWDPGLPIEAYVSSLAVAPAYRRRGVAQALMAAAERCAAAAGHAAVQLQVEEDNAAAIGLYVGRLGYEQVGRDPLARKLVGDIFFGRSERVVKLALQKAVGPIGEAAEAAVGAAAEAAAGAAVEAAVGGDARARCRYGTKAYWDRMYAGSGELPADAHSWYCGFEELRPFWAELVPRTSAVLVPGVGNDRALGALYDAGWWELTAFDYSAGAVERARALLGERPVALLRADARELPFGAASFDAVLDKGALDAVDLAGDGSLDAAVAELSRVVRPGGVVVSVSRVLGADALLPAFADAEWENVRDGADYFAADGESTRDLDASLLAWRRRG